MKHQQVSVDYWAMGKAMLTYGALTGLCWIMMRLFSNVFSLPRRLRAQQDQIQNSLQELQKRFPDLNITEEDLKNAEKELDELIKESEKEEKEGKDRDKTDDKETDKVEDKDKSSDAKPIEDKKTI